MAGDAAAAAPQGILQLPLNPSLSVFTGNRSTDRIRFSIWYELFENACFLFGIPEEPKDDDGNFLPQVNRRRVFFLCHLGFDVIRTLLGSCHPNEPRTKPIPELVEILRQAYDPPRNKLICRMKFLRRKQEENESVRHFINALLHLAADCDYGAFHKEALRDQLIAGIRDTEILRELLSAEGDPSFESARLIAMRHEEVSNCLKKLRLEEKENPAPSCTRCGRGHNTEECPAREWICRNCEQMGHIARMCPRSNNQTDTDSDTDY